MTTLYWLAGLFGGGTIIAVGLKVAGWFRNDRQADNAKANAETARMFKEDAELNASPTRTLAEIVDSMRKLRDK